MMLCAVSPEMLLITLLSCSHVAHPRNLPSSSVGAILPLHNLWVNNLCLVWIRPIHHTGGRRQPSIRVPGDITFSLVLS
ncbi:hypothetical protein B0H14DRAFT_665553 [Mycena olivaceomarginata]|nr:hypothetical protein B0H14DRAFT_665553 [Mycena olivaceomarginata]